MSGAPLTSHRVAVVVFCETMAVTYHDAGRIAEEAIAKQLHATTDYGVTLQDGTAVEVNVGLICEAKSATRNGYLTVVPISEAYRL
jgi:hypothetical protein